ncbi:MAG TPA: aminotransferase class V-fold PLP-dependent enzyme [Longimicrobiaceae bacterium]|nr:aminotransferase class V-fold PLP-dependent enzyme [Longimicrobiaceae bacterium]
MSRVPHPELERWRDEFPILATRTYLNSCSLGPLSRRSMGYLGEFQALWNTMGASAWYELWLGRLAELRASVAHLWNAQETEIALMPSVSAALGAVASAVDYRERNKVVVAELDFPTQIYQWMVKPGVEVVRVPSDDGVSIAADRWAEHIDGRTAVVATSHVFYSTGCIQELSRIAEVAHGAGALFIVDGYHGAGQVPVDPRAAGADVYLAGPLKWLLGGPGMAFLWVREERITGLEPTLASWFGARDQFQFQADHFAFREDAARFELGTPALPTMYTALGGLEIIHEVGTERIRTRNAALTEDLIARAREAGLPLRIAGEPERRSAIVMLRMPRAGEVVERLGRRGIIVDRRGEYIRVSPHFYNTAAENGELVAALAELRPAQP